jgi:hypothetical protein
LPCLSAFRADTPPMLFCVKPDCRKRSNLAALGSVAPNSVFGGCLWRVFTGQWRFGRHALGF